MQTLKKLWNGIEYLCSIILPSIAFAAMFVGFCLQVISRYILGSQIPWTYELCVVGFLWTTAFGAIWAGRNHEHVSFSLIYDMFGPKGRAVMNLIGNILISVAFILLIPAAYEYVEFIGIKVTAVLRVSFSYLYAPFLFFIVFSTIYMIRDSVKDIMTLRTPTDVLLAQEAAAKLAAEQEEEGGES